MAPSEVSTPGKDWIKIIDESAELPKVVAIGETGLDYYKQYGDKRSQIELFITQLDLAQKHNKPVIIHNREAGQDIFEILQDRIPSKGAVFHCYSEDAAYANKCLDAGLNVYFSFAGNLTYRNARNLHDTITQECRGYGQNFHRNGKPVHDSCRIPRKEEDNACISAFNGKIPRRNAGDGS